MEATGRRQQDHGPDFLRPPVDRVHSRLLSQGEAVNAVCARAFGSANRRKLQRNLVKNGGILDGVIFLQRTTDEDDLKFLDKLLESEPDYTKWVIDMNEDGFASSYDRIQDDVMYIKMDDDIV